jgi:hypothetical protein
MLSVFFIVCFVLSSSDCCGFFGDFSVLLRFNGSGSVLYDIVLLYQKRKGMESTARAGFFTFHAGLSQKSCIIKEAGGLCDQQGPPFAFRLFPEKPAAGSVHRSIYFSSIFQTACCSL